MSDSLRDQLLQAGFKPAAKTNQKKAHTKKPKRPTGSRGQETRQATRQPAHGEGRKTKKEPVLQELSEIERLEAIARKEKKQQIAALIESHAVKDHKGDAAYSYMAGKKVRQMFVSEDCRKKLASSELVITRLNGNTWLIPPQTGEAILAINPDWAVISNEDSSDSNSTSDDYAEFQIPDDLQW